MNRHGFLTRMLAMLSALTIALLPWAGTVMALQSVSSGVTMPIALSGTVETADCTNSPGPWITFDGSLVLSGLGTRLIFRNNINKDVHTREEDIQDLVEVSTGDEIVIPKQPVRGGVGGNPFIWVQLVDMNGSPLTSEVFLGRCVQGVMHPEVDFATPALAQAITDVLDCTNNPGPYINVWGSLSFNPGVKARFIFRNNDNPVGGPHEADAFVDLILISNGFTLQFPKQPVQGGVGGNPWISVQFIDGDAQPVSQEYLLGRCVQLQPGN